MEDLISFINKSSKNKGLINCLYGIKRINGVIHGLIMEEDKPMFLIPKHQLCTYHELLIDKWFEINKE